MRRKLVTKGKFNIQTGKTSVVKKEWIVEKCGTPLFQKDDCVNGICTSCKSGWTHENNFRVFPFKFWKENRLDQEYELSLDIIIEKFKIWMKSKERAWLEYYCSRLVVDFITDNKNEYALNSVSEDIDILDEYLSDVKWQYLNSIGIK